MSETAAITPEVIQHGMNAEAFANWIGVPAETAADSSAEAETPAAEATEAAEETAAEETPAEEASEEAAEETASEPADDASEPASEAAPEAKGKKSLPFTVTGKDGGDLDVNALDGMTVTMKANGKEVVLSIADVVRRAASESGAMQHSRKLETQLASLNSLIGERESENDKLRELARNAVLDDEYREKLREELEEYERPESELSRLRAAREAETRKQENDKQERARSETAAAFMKGTVLPSVDALLKANPTVSYEELLGRFSTETGALLVNGVIPQSAYDEVGTILNGSLAQWVRKQHAARTTATKTRETAQQAKNNKAKTVKPIGNAGRTGSEAPKAKPAIKTHKDAAAFAFSAFTE